VTDQLSPVIQCSVCHVTADMRKDPHAWDSWSWTSMSSQKCPHCNGQDKVIAAEAEKSANLAMMATV